LVAQSKNGSQEFHKITTLTCECCGGDADFTEEGRNTEYQDILCSECEAGNHKESCES